MSDGGWTLLVLAAGAGSRYGGAKQLEAFGPDGERLSDYALDHAVAAGADRAVFVIRAEHEPSWRDHHARRRPSLDLRYVHQRLHDLPRGFHPPPARTRPWGTAHAVLAAREQLGGAFVIVNADDHYGPEAIAAASQFLSDSQTARPSDARLAALASIAFPLDETLSRNGPVSRALLTIDAQDRLLAIEERHDLIRARGEWVSMNCWACGAGTPALLEPVFVEFLEQHHGSLDVECALPEAIGTLVARGTQVRVLRSGRGWLGVTYAADRAAVMARLAR